MTIRKERRRLEKRLKRTQYTQKSITMATTLVAGSTFIPTLGHAAETATTETSNDLKCLQLIFDVIKSTMESNFHLSRFLQ